jgi:hypothetical protein
MQLSRRARVFKCSPQRSAQASPAADFRCRYCFCCCCTCSCPQGPRFASAALSRWHHTNPRCNRLLARLNRHGSRHRHVQRTALRHMPALHDHRAAAGKQQISLQSSARVHSNWPRRSTHGWCALSDRHVQAEHGKRCDMYAVSWEYQHYWCWRCVCRQLHR